MPTEVAKKQPSQRKRLHELDVLRGLAAIGVVLCHYTSECNVVGSLAPESVFRLGSYGPHLFFIISGFVIFMSLERCKRSADFAFLRFARLYPVYWFGVVFSTVVLLLSSQDVVPVPTMKQFTGNLTMLQTWLRIPDIEVSYWTLGVELKFYVLAFILLSTQQIKRAELLVCGWLGSVAAFHCLDAWIGLPGIVGTPLIANYAHLFAAGIMFYRIHKEGHSHLRNAVILWALPIQLLLEGLESAIVVSGCIAAFYLFVSGWLRWTVNKPLQFLGDISYPLYLVHGSLGVAMIHALASWDTPLWLMLTLPILASISLATLLHFHFEKPSGKLLRGWWKRRSESQQLVAS